MMRRALSFACGLAAAAAADADAATSAFANAFADPAAWAAYEAIYAASWKPAEGKPAMLRRFAEQEGAAGRLMSAAHGDLLIALAFPRYSADVTDLPNAAQRAGDAAL